MANPLAITLHELVPELLNGSSLPVDIGRPAPNAAAQCDRDVCFLTVDLVELSKGINLSLETSIGGYDWTVLASTEGAENVPKAVQLFAFHCKRFLRCSWTLNGNGASATFSVIGEAHQCYINMHDIEQSMPANMFAAMPPEVLAHAMLDATDEASSYLRAHYQMPLKSWDHALRLFVGKMAFYHAMKRRGFNPDSIDQHIRDNYKDAVEWCKTTAKYADIVDNTPSEVETGAYMVSAPPRGWYPW